MLTDLGKAALSPFLRQIADKEITVDWQVPPALTINVNSVLVKEAFANVFKNAVAHTPVGGRMSVRPPWWAWFSLMGLEIPSVRL